MCLDQLMITILRLISILELQIVTQSIFVIIQVFSDDADFAILFLERLGAGIHGDRVRMSRVDSEVVMRTYRECVMYLMTRFKPVQSLCPVFSQVGGSGLL